MKINIIGTGSDGNCFLFNNDLIIDMGLSYRKMTEAIDVKGIKYILLTHIHGDHFNRTAVRKMFVNTDAIFMCCGFLVDYLLSVGVYENRIKVLNIGEVYTVGDFKISPFHLYHDVDNVGYRIAYKGHKHIHATDTSTLQGITAKNYDSATIECNHCETKANEIIDDAKENGEFCHLVGAVNSHLSVQQTIDFCKKNNIKNLIPVHIGGSTKKEVLDLLGGSK